MDHDRVEGLGSVAGWARVVLPLLLVVLGAGTARAGGPWVGEEQITHQFDWLQYVMTGITVVTVLGAGILVLGVAVHVYVRWSRPADPLKVALSDPWVRANLERLGGDAAGTETPGPDNTDGVQAAPPPADAGPSA